MLKFKDRNGNNFSVRDDEKLESITLTTFLSNGSYSDIYHNAFIESFRENSDGTIAIILRPDYVTSAIDK